MFNFFKKKTSTEIIDEKEDDESSISLGAGVAATESARVSTQAAAQKFAKPTKYDRSILDDGAAKINSKKMLLNRGSKLRTNIQVMLLP